MEITVGMKGEVATLAEREDTAKEVGSGSLLVYATPCMVALMEGAACEAIQEALSDSQTTVGTELNIQHISATPVGLEVRAEAEVTAAREALLSSLRATHDAPGSIESYYSTAALSGLSMAPPEYIRAVEAVTVEQAAAAARTLTLHTTYVLKEAAPC